MSDDIVDVWRKFYVRTWTDKRVMALSRPTPNGQTLLTWLIAGRQTGIIPGLFEIGERAFAELMNWPLHGGESLLHDLPKGLPKGFREAFAEVAAQGFVKADWNARLVYVPGGLKLDPPSNPNMILKWRKAWRELPECDLKDEARQSFKRFFERYSKGFQEAFEVVCGNPLANQDSGFRKQDSGGGKRKKASPVPKVQPEVVPEITTMAEAKATTVSTADAKELYDHWAAERKRVRSMAAPIIEPPAALSAAKYLLAIAGMDEARRIVTAFVESDHEYWADNDWPLALLMNERDLDRAVNLATKGKRNTSSSRIPKNDIAAQMRAQRAQVEAERAAERAQRGEEVADVTTP